MTIVPTIQKPDMFNKMVPIYLDFKWLGFHISDPIWNSDHLKPNTRDS